MHTIVKKLIEDIHLFVFDVYADIAGLQTMANYYSGQIGVFDKKLPI